MPLLNTIRRLFRRETDAECIERARKRVQSIEKWGIWAAIFQLTMGIAFAALAIAFGYCLECVADFGGNGQNPAMPQVPNLIWQGFVLGLVFGAISGYLLFKGAHLVVQAIEMFRGDKTYTLLVRYHDGIVSMIEDEREGSGNAAIGKPLREEDHERAKARIAPSKLGEGGQCT